MKVKPIFKILILVSILAVPGFLFFYLLPNVAKNRYKTLPVYGEKVLTGTFTSKKGKQIPDTLFYIIPDFSLKNQFDSIVTWNDYKNKIVVLNLFHTNTPIKYIIKNFKGITDGYSRNTFLKFISISVDPTDNAKTTMSYLNDNALNSNQWNLLTGDTSVVYPFIRDGLLLDVLEDNTNSGKKFIYSNQLILIDIQRRIRGIYDASSKEAMAKLDDEIKVLIAEDVKKLNDGR